MRHGIVFVLPRFAHPGLEVIPRSTWTVGGELWEDDDLELPISLPGNRKCGVERRHGIVVVSIHLVDRQIVYRLIAADGPADTRDDRGVVAAEAGYRPHQLIAALWHPIDID